MSRLRNCLDCDLALVGEFDGVAEEVKKAPELSRRSSP